MYKADFKFSIIIPHYNSLDSLPRLLDSIPVRDDIEVIVVDNSPAKISVTDVKSDRQFRLLYSSNSRRAGGARNIGLDASRGEWIIFADSDDYFTPEAFDVFLSYANSNSDLIYFKVKSVYDDTLLPTDRDEMWNQIIDNFNNGTIDEISTRIAYVVPWGKMIRREMIILNDIHFDEMPVAEDVMFSTKVGLIANKFAVSNKTVYVVTTRAGSLSNRRDLEAIKSRYLVAIKRNLYLKEQGYKNRQGSIMYFLFEALKFGVKPFLKFCCIAVQYKQNPFIGYNNWLRTFNKIKKESKINKKYITG